MYYANEIVSLIYEVLDKSSFISVNISLSHYDTFEMVKSLKKLGYIENPLIVTGEDGVSFAGSTRIINSVDAMIRYGSYNFKDKVTRYSDDKSSLDNYKQLLDTFNKYDVVILDNVNLNQLRLQIEKTRQMDTALAVYQMLWALVNCEAAVLFINCVDVNEYLALMRITNKGEYVSRKKSVFTLKDLLSLRTTYF